MIVIISFISSIGFSARRILPLSAMPLMPVFINKKTAKELSEFLYLRYETQKPGILQVLRYTFDVTSAEIVYIPYYKEEAGYIPGV